MSLIERLQRLDERLGLDGPRRRQEQEERRVALEALPSPARQSLTRLRILALVLLSVALVGMGLPMYVYTSMGDLVVVAFGFIGPFGGIFVGRRVERHVLEKHGHVESGDL